MTSKYKKIKFHLSFIKTIVFVIFIVGFYVPFQFGVVHSAPQKFDSPLIISSSLSHSQIGPGSVSTLRLDLENPNVDAVGGIHFDYLLPGYVFVNDPSINKTTCIGANLEAVYQGNRISLEGGSLERNGTCYIEIDITSSVVGSYSFPLLTITSTAGESSILIDNFSVLETSPGFFMEFSPSEVFINQITRLTYTIDNSNNPTNIFNLQFLNTLPNGLIIAENPNIASTCPGDAITAYAGGNTISYSSIYTGLLLNAGATCTIAVNVKVVSRESFLINNYAELYFLSTLNWVQVSAGKANASLSLNFDSNLRFDKNTENYWTRGGETIDINYQISNFSRDESMTLIEFYEDFGAVLPGVVISNFPAQNSCGVGSEINLTGENTIHFSGGNLPPESSCAFLMSVSIPEEAAYDRYEFSSSTISGLVGGKSFEGYPSYLSVEVAPVPKFTKSFQSAYEPIYAGDEITLNYRIENISDKNSISNVGFSDPLLEYFVKTNLITLPDQNFCGPGSTAIYSVHSNPPTLIFSSISIEEGGVCEFLINLMVPYGFPSSEFLSESNSLAYTFDGKNLIGTKAVDTLNIQSLPLTVTREFSDDNKIPGDIVEVIYRLSNQSISGENPGIGVDINSIQFEDDLSLFLNGLTISSIPEQAGVCGNSSRISGTTSILFEDGFLAAGEECEFRVLLEIPEMASPGEYGELVSTDVDFVVDSRSLVGKIGRSELVIGGIDYEMNINQTEVFPGDMVDLEFLFQNNTQYGLSDGHFHINLTNWMAGLQTSGLPLTDVCGPGSQIFLSGSQILFFGLSLQSDQSCEFSIPMLIPLDVVVSDYLGVSTDFSFMLNGNPVILPPMSGSISIGFPFTVTKQFLSEAAAPGGTIDVRYSITNHHISEVLTEIKFNEDFESATNGLSVVGLPVTDVCGPGSLLDDGEHLISFTGGSLPPESSCIFDLTIQVPVNFGNTTLMESTTTSMSGMVHGYEFKQANIMDSFEIYGLIIEFTGNSPEVFDPVQFGYKLRNISADEINIDFNLDLNKIIPGLRMISDPQLDICGVGSSVVGSTSLYAAEIVIPAGEECSFIFEVELPGVSPGHYASVEPEVRSDDPLSFTYNEISDVFVFYKTMLIIILNNSPFP